MIITAPEQNFNNRNISVFLAGTIDNGNSLDWQAAVAGSLQNTYPNLDIYNPRRALWDPEAGNTEMLEQINWEQKYLSKVDIIFFNFLADSKSPVTLLELGQALGLGKSVVIVCPTEFYRYWNVKQTALFHNRLVYPNLTTGLARLESHLAALS